MAALMGALILLLTTFIWGTAFLAQKIGGEALGPFAVTCFRNILGGLFLFLCIFLRNLTSRNRGTSPRSGFRASGSLLAGFLCGVPLFAAMAAQQIGIGYTTPGISGFLTTNYMFVIPVLCLVLYRKLPGWHIWVGVAAAIAGTYLICMTDERMTVGRGELWTILCAFLFAVQMLVVDHYAKRCDVLVMSAVQLLTAAFLSVPFLFLHSESSRLSLSALCTLRSAFPVFYLGVFSSGIAYTLQNFGQSRTSPAVAGVILSMESVFAALSGYVVLGDRMTAAQSAGCIMVFFAAVFTQIFDIISSRKSDS